uniref:GTPase, IMAP family member 2 n=1 Tax=Gorilla gorilla gorilla TaxID=9595 RepID=A0A2I2YPI7_GORGO
QNEHSHWGERKVKGAIWPHLSKLQCSVSGAAWLLFSEYRNV